MSFLTTYWKKLAGIALIFIIFLFGWYKGNEYQKAKFEAFKLEVAVNAKIQEQKNKDLLIKQKKVTENITKEYEDAIKKLNAYHAANRMLNSSSSSKMSNTSKSSSTTYGETESNLSSTLRDCSLDVLQLLYLQEWIKSQELLNEEGQ
jgi:CRISPR/Cas system endoribonuclease Cas6 (RAMP superfamily)